MNLTTEMEKLRSESTSDLYRLMLALEKEIESPKRMQAIKNRLYIGMELAFFDQTTNRTIPATVLEIKRTKARVLTLETQERWIVSFYTLVLDDRSMDIDSPTLDRVSLKVGDLVGFDYQGVRYSGHITKLNPKTASLKTTTGQKWRVSYSQLMRVHQGEAFEVEFMELPSGSS